MIKRVQYHGVSFPSTISNLPNLKHAFGQGVTETGTMDEGLQSGKEETTLIGISTATR